MIPLPRILFGAAVAVLLFGAVAFGLDSCGKSRANKSEIDAAFNKGQASGFRDGAAKADKEVEGLSVQVARQDENVARLVSERDAALQRLAASRRAGQPAVGPSDSSPKPPVVVVDQEDARDGVILADARLIDGLQTQVKGLQAENLALVTARDQWKLASEAEARRAAGLQIALDAQKHVAASGKWLGRVQGFAVGAALGYVGGKR